MTGELETADQLDSRHYEIAIRKLADALAYGTDRSAFLGSGIEFVQSRPYQPGDSIRSIDWKVTARTGRFYVKEYEAPKQMPCYILMDTSASMVITSVKKSKYAIAVHIAGGIAFACLDRVSPVGIVGVGGREMKVDPSLSPGQILQWLHNLRRFRYDEQTTLGQRVVELAPTLTSRTLVIAVTDLHDMQAVPALKLLAQRHDVCVIRLMDPAEKGIAGSGFLRASEAESDRVFVTWGRRSWVDPDETATALKRSGVDYLLLPTDVPFVAGLRNFLRSRNLLGRGAR